VILVDANLRAPVQHTLLGASDDRGLADLLEEARALKARASSTTAEQSIRLAVSERRPERVHATVDPLEWAATEESPESNHSMPAADGRANDVTATATATATANGQEKSDRIERTALIGWTPDSRDGHVGTTNIDNLHVLPAGKASVSPIALLCMPEMKGLLEWAAQRSDFVVVDCPALTHAEAHVLGALSDEMLLVVDATRDTVQQVLNAKAGLTNTAVKVSGLVVNKLGRWI
jgi:Mrp family chromosome partitioning ATPase